MNTTNTFNTLLHSIKLSMTGKYLVYIVQLVSMMILARVFTPETFGIFAAIQVFAVFFALISEMGIGPALVNEGKISKSTRDGIYTFTWMLGIAVAIVFAVVSPLIAIFYENEIYKFLFIPIAIGVIFNSTSIVPVAGLNRDKLFIKIARCEAVAEFSALFVVLILAYLIEPIWALASKPLAFAIIRFITVRKASSISELGKPSFGKKICSINKIIKFSKNQALFNYINYFSRNLDNILVGKYLGISSLAVYDKAYQLMRYPLMLLTFAMSPAIQPVMKNLQGDVKEFEKIHNKFVRYLSVVGVVVGALVYFTSELIVNILLGSQWSEVVPIISILALIIPIQVVLSTSGGFYQAMNRTDLLLVCGMFSAFTNVAAIIYGVYLGELKIICWLLLVSFSINFMQCYILMYKVMFKVKFRSFAFSLLPGLVLFSIFLLYAFTNEYK